MADRILILGASARAAAASARRAGLEPFAVDLFADRDTEILCERVWRCPPDRYPNGLFELAKQAPPMPWMYTGGLENYPELIGELANERELWGNGPEVLRKVRNPRWLSEQRHLVGASYPPAVMPGDAPPESGTWVRKPLRGSGGRGVQIANADDVRGIANPSGGFFLQEFVNGCPASLLFRDGRPVGVTSQLVGTAWLHAAPFAYAGSAAQPWESTAAATGVAESLSLEGLWGVDLLIDGGRRVLIEVNPRYPASAEVAELTLRRSLLSSARHCDTTPPAKSFGKAIYYAPLRIAFPASGPWDDSLARAADVWHRPDFADIPHPDDAIEPGHPVLTVLTEADTEGECLRRLQSRAAELDRLFGFPPPHRGAPCSP